MTPLKTGLGTIRQNVITLMSPLIGQTRKKAIQTISKERNISLGDAQYLQAVRIAQRQARTKQ